MTLTDILLDGENIILETPRNNCNWVAVIKRKNLTK